MSDITKKASYLRGYADGLDISPKSDEGKLIGKMLELIEEMAEMIDELDYVQCETIDIIDDLEEDMALIVDDFYGEDDEEDDVEDWDEDDEDDDDNWYDFIKLWAVLSKKIGYRGLVVFIDECVNLYKIPNRISRENNYEIILSMFNDTLQGRAPGLDIIFGGTPQFLEDTRRGLFSYEALRSRLCDSRFALDGFKNLIGPVIRLRRLSDDELFALIQRVTVLYSQYYNWECTVSNEDRLKFLNICLSRAGADS